MAIETYVYCDICSDGYCWHKAIAKTLAIDMMRTKGWTVGKYWRCPNCRNQKKVKQK